MKNTRKYFLLLFFALCAPLLAAPQKAGGTMSVQDIAGKWREIEQIDDQAALLDALDDFYASVKEFQNSEMYRIYRFVLARPEARQALRLSAHGEIIEIQRILDSVVELRQAVSGGSMEKANLIYRDISNAIFDLLLHDIETNHFSTFAFFRLLLVFLAFMVMTAIAVRFHYKTLLKSMAKEEETLRYTQAFFFAQEEERQRISRELHDTVAQDLLSLSLGMEKIGKTDGREQRLKLCEEAAAIHTFLIRRIRDICVSLVPPDFRSQNLGDALRKLCFDYKNRSNVDCRIEIAENLNIDFLEKEEQLQVFRIVQEALTNVEKHARAKEAIVIMRSNENGDIFIGISDDGHGFDSKAAVKSINSRKQLSKLGITGMEKRASLLGGTLSIKSEKGEGTLVRLEIPRKGDNSR